MSKGFGGGGRDVGTQAAAPQARGGYRGLRDMVDGGGAGASGSTFSGGGIVSRAANGMGLQPMGQRTGMAPQAGGGGGSGAMDEIARFLTQAGGLAPGQRPNAVQLSSPAVVAPLGPPAATQPASAGQPQGVSPVSRFVGGQSQNGTVTPAMMQILQTMVPQGMNLEALNLRPLLNRGG